MQKQEVLAFQERIKNEPVWFVNNVLHRKTWHKEEEILNAVNQYAEVSVRSCNGSGKTYTAGGMVHWWLMAYEDSVVITTAPTFRQVKELLWREVKSAVYPGMYPSNTVLDTKIDIGPKWFALGISSDKPDQFQGFHSKHLLVIVDEASGVSEDIFQAIDGLNPTKLVLLGNPMQNSGRFADSFKQEGVKKISISALESPNITSPNKEVVINGLIQQRDIDRIIAKYGEDSDVYRIRVLGEFPKSDTNTIISVDEVAKAIARDVAVLPHWEKKMGVDPARFGDDRSVIIIRQMEKVVYKETYSGQDTMQITGHLLRIAKEHFIKAENINIDSIGIGAGIVDRCKEQGWQVNPVNVAEKADDYEHYLNLRAELYADKIKNWIKTADLPDDDDYYEMANIRYKFNSKGQIQLESKEDMKKRGLPSPDVADAIALTFANSRYIGYNYTATAPALPYYGDKDLDF